MADLLIKGSLILILGTLLNLALRRAPASVRHTVWSTSLAALTLLPLAIVTLPTQELAWLPAGPSMLRPSVTPDVWSTDAERSEAAQSPPSLPRSSARDSRRAGPDTAVPAVPARSSPRLWLVLWLVGTAAGLCRLAASLAHLRRLSRNARELAADPAWNVAAWNDTLTSLRRRLAIRRPVRLATHAAVRTPLTYGIFRPMVLLPPEARHYEAAERSDVLAHELAHISRLDWSSSLFARFTCALYWFHPLVWIAARRLTFEAERACDDRVLLLGSPATSYAERLLGMARQAHRRAGAVPITAVAMARPGELSRRIAAILDPSLRRTTMQRTQILTSSCLTLFLLLVLAPAQLVRADHPESDLDFAFDGDGTPLIMAAGSGRTELVRLLLDAGADPDRAAEGDGNPLIAAASRGDREIVEILLDAGADLDAGVPGDGNPLIMAARSGHDDVVELLLDHGADIDRAVEGDETALIQAAGNGHLDTVRLLIDRGADVDKSVLANRHTASAELRSPLSMARRGGHDAVARLLLDRGAVE